MSVVKRVAADHATGQQRYRACKLYACCKTTKYVVSMLQDYKYVATLQACCNTASMLQHYKHVARLQACCKTTCMLQHFKHAATLQACCKTTCMLQHFKHAATLQACEGTSCIVPGEPIPASMGSSLRYADTGASGANPGEKPRAL